MEGKEMAKIMYEKWKTLLETEVDNKSIYLWGGQGETLGKLTDSYIKKKETSTSNAKRVIKLRDARKKKHPKLRAFDCSGLGVCLLQKYGVIKNDMTANGLMGKCTAISKAKLQPGDFVFRTYRSGKDKGRAYHIGYVVDGLYIIHAKGRDEGVVKEKLNQNGSSYWNAFGRPTVYIEVPKAAAAEVYTFERLMKKKSPLMKGNDVRNLQKLLKAAGISPGTIDGEFGKNTQKAVKLFQKANALKQDGIVGRNTITALGGKWRG